MLFVGIDGEMSCPDMEAGGRLIQIGLAVEVAGAIEGVAFLIKPTEGMYWEENAAAVHGIPLEDLEDYGIHQDDVDSMLYRWLVNHGADPKHRAKTVPVGFNITGFDMPFIKATLPKTYSLLSRRTAELNGMLWLLHGRVENGMPVKFETWKKRSMDYAASKLDDFKPHDAGWDAKRHLLCYEYLRSVILG
jgi:hypothetical protein